MEILIDMAFWTYLHTQNQLSYIQGDHYNHNYHDNQTSSAIEFKNWDFSPVDDLKTFEYQW